MSIRTVSTRRPAFGLSSTFNDFFEPWGEWFQDGVLNKQLSVPKVNITEDKSSYNLELAVPGLHKKDFKIEVNGNILTVSAEKEANNEEKNEQYTRQEYNYSSFTRSFTLPEELNQDNIEATYDGGVLKLHLPKNEKAVKANRKAITIK